MGTYIAGARGSVNGDKDSKDDKDDRDGGNERDDRDGGRGAAGKCNVMPCHKR